MLRQTDSIRVERSTSGRWTAYTTSSGREWAERTLRSLRRRIAKDFAPLAAPTEELALSSDASSALEAVFRTRAEAARSRSASKDALQHAVVLLLGNGLSRRDTAELLGISHQRVQQLSHPEQGDGTPASRDDALPDG